MTEDELLNEVQKLAKLNGWLMAHFRPARTGRTYISKGQIKELWVTPMQGDPGFMDCVLAKKKPEYCPHCNRVTSRFDLELKTEKGTLSKGQPEWLTATGGQVLRPSGLEWLARRLR